MKRLMEWMLAAVCVSVVGCAKLGPATVDAIGSAIEEAIAAYDEADAPVETPVAPPPPVVVTPQPDKPELPIVTNASDFAGITRFRNSKDCRDWPVTVTISDVAVRGGKITWRESGAPREWNRFSSKGKTIDGECLLVIPSIGTAGMFDYKRVGQREKTLSNLVPSSHGPGFFPAWTPKKGERVGFLIATISRNAAHAKMRERSNVVWITWPRDGF